MGDIIGSLNTEDVRKIMRSLNKMDDIIESLNTENVEYSDEIKVLVDSLNKNDVDEIMKFLNRIESIEYSERLDNIIFSILKLWNPDVSELFLSKIDKIKIKPGEITVEDKYDIEYIEMYTVKFLTMFFKDKSMAKDIWKIFDEDKILSQNIGRFHIFFIEKCISFVDMLEEHNNNNNISKDVVINDMKVVKVIIKYFSKFMTNNKIINEVLLSIPEDLKDDWKTGDILDKFQNIPMLFM